MGMFKDPKDEERVCNVLKAYVEEFSAPEVTVALPASWGKDYGDCKLGQAKMEFSTLDSIKVTAYTRNYEVFLQQ